MASDISTSLDKEDNFVSELGRVRDEIKIKFVELIDHIKARECQLLKELDTILTSHLSYLIEAQKLTEMNYIEEAINPDDRNESNIPFLNNHAQSIFNEIDNKFKSIESATDPNMVHFVCDNFKMFSEIEKFGILMEKYEKNISYESKVQSSVSVCEKGCGVEQLNYPWGVAVDYKTGNIYVADQFNHFVKVFDSSGKFLFKFGDNYGEGRMEYPKGFAICGDIILISHEILSLHNSNYNILIYQLNGKFISRIGTSGKGKLEFNFPCGIACDNSNGNIYICDNNNDRVQVLSKLFIFKTQFGIDKLNSPLDVKLSQKYVYVLDNSDPCIHLYNFNHILQKSIISRGERMQVVKPYCFCIDSSENILITDRSSNAILIFNPKFEMCHKMNTSQFPMGIAVDYQNRVIVVCRSRRDCLQIF